MSILIVTGLSGAGKSTVLNTLEDCGHETIDNVPLTLLPVLVSYERQQQRDLVVGCDIRSRDFSVEGLLEVIHDIQEQSKQVVKLLYLTSDDDILQRRYTETRRKHPLAEDRPVLAGIRKERALFESVRQYADEVLDTSYLSAAELRQHIQDKYANGQSSLSIHLQSFSFKRGIPREADLVFDVRFLKNPYYDSLLREMNGCDGPIGEYIRQDESFSLFFDHLVGLLKPLLPRYQKEGKSYLTIAIGCTGGKHRSVFVVEELAKVLASGDYVLKHRHRDLTRG